MDAITSFLSTTTNNSMSATRSAEAKDTASKLSSNSSKEEMTEAVKSFEQYFVEQLIKEVKETLKDDEEDGTMSQYKDFFMDSAISTVAEQLVDEVGGKLTDDMVAQMMRNYGITEEDEAVE